jgi:CheY-like chemotaxis protein/HPt (histidine-containing phosphotransfer) domain-containing protein
VKRLLLVDDDAAIRAIARISLERVGNWAVVEAGSGQAALQAARAHPCDAILLDVMMGGIDGPTTLKLLREDPRLADVPTIFLTAKVRAGEPERLRALGAAGVIAKPFDPMMLATEVERILGRAEAASTAPALDSFWARSRPLVEERIATLCTAAAALAAGEDGPTAHEAALTEAHRLAGLLGTVGVERGSVVAREIEQGLRDGADPRRTYQLAVELREVVAGAVGESRTTSRGSAKCDEPKRDQ